MAATQPSHRSRAITPLIVSTAEDFERERAYLKKTVYPLVDDICLKQGTRFTPVDLNESITSEQIENIEFVQTSLDYVRTCAPFFIAILGERYGVHKPPAGKTTSTLPSTDTGPLLPTADRAPSALSIHPRQHRRSTIISQSSGLRSHRWLTRSFQRAAASGYKWILNDAYENSSVLELQIVQAAFLNTCEHCLFYFRVPGHVDALCEGLGELEQAELRRLYDAESDYAGMKMKDLKQRIVKRGLSVRHFTTLDDLREAIMEDVAQLLRQLPAPTYDLSCSRSLQHRAHSVLAESRRQVFVPNSQSLAVAKRLTDFVAEASSVSPKSENLQTQLRDFFRRDYSKLLQRTYDKLAARSSGDESEKRICVLSGERGCGKTAFISNWLNSYRQGRSEPPLIVEHFIGASVESHDILKSLQRITTLIRNFYDIHSNESMEEPDNPDQAYFFACQAFEAALGLGPVIVVMDGLDCLGQTRAHTAEQVKGMEWLPANLPPTCRLILTSIASDLSYKSLATRSDVLYVNISLSTSLDEDMFQLEELASHNEQNLSDHMGDEFKQWPLRGSPLAQLLLVQERHLLSQGEFTEALEDMLETQTLRDLATKLLRRWVANHSWIKLSLMDQSEKSMEKDDTQKKADWDGWVPDLLSLLVTARQGLTIDMICEALFELGYGRDAEVKAFEIYRFMNSATRVLVLVDGEVRFSHLHFKEICDHLFLGNVTNASVKSRCLENNASSSADTRHRLHIILAEIFLKRKNVCEALYHLDRASEYERLRTLLTMPKTLTVYFSDKEDEDRVTHRDDYLFYWHTVSKKGYKPLQFLGEHIQRVLDLELEMPSEPDLPEPKVAVVDDEDDFLKASANRKITRGTKSPSTPPQPMSSRPSSRPISSRMSTDTDATGADVQDIMTDVPTVVIDTLSTEPSSRLVTPSKSETSDDDDTDSEVVDFAIACGNLLFALGLTKLSLKVSTLAHRLYEETGPASPMELLRLARLELSLGWRSEKKSASSWLHSAVRTCDTFLLVTNSEEEPVDPSEVLAHRFVLAIRGRAVILCLEKAHSPSKLADLASCARGARSITLRAATSRETGVFRHSSLEFKMSNDDFSTALRLLQQWFGRCHPQVADVLVLMAQLRADARWRDGYDPLLAEALYRRTCHIRRVGLSADDLSLADAMTALGELLMRETYRSSLDEAHNLLTEALDIRVKRVGPEHSSSERTLLLLRDLETQQNRLARHQWRPPTRSLSGSASPVNGNSRPSSANSQLSMRPRQRRPTLTGILKDHRPTSRSLDDQLPNWTSPENAPTRLQETERFLYASTFLNSARGGTSLLNTMAGPNSSINSVGGPLPGWTVRQMLERDIQFKSAWYQIPGRQLPAELRKARAQKQEKVGGALSNGASGSIRNSPPVL